MPKMKNAKRKHFLAPWLPTAPATEPGNDAWKWLADGVKTAEAENARIQMTLHTTTARYQKKL